MLQNMFTQIITMSMTAIPIILFVLIARFFFIKAPKIFSYVLWVFVLFRLLCPFSFETTFSPIPEAFINGKVLESYTDSYIGDINVYEEGTKEYNAALEQGMKPVITNKVETGKTGSYIITTKDGTKEAKTAGELMLPILSVIWIIGIMVLVTYSFISLLQLKKRLVGAIPWKNNIYRADHIGAPFVLGLIQPKIYLPSTMSEKEYEYIILHENQHIKRKDHIFKLLAFIALCIHWFNPLVWLSYVLATKDMEMSCDEAVLKRLGENVKSNYSASLLSFATGKQSMSVTFLGFGEGDPKVRIKNVLKWKKPIVVYSALCAVLVLFIGIFCLSNPLNEANLEKTRSIISNNNRYLFVSEDEDFIYFVDVITVKKISKMDNSVEDIYTFEDINDLVNIFECFEGRLYFITYQGDFISMDTNGENIIKSTFSLDASDELLEYSSPLAQPYVYGNDLYFIVGQAGDVYRVDPDTLTLELADSEIIYQYITPDKTIFTKTTENDAGRLYVTYEDGQTTLFSGEDESVILNRVNYTDAYVFYTAFKLNDFSSLNLYRVDLDGKNKVLIKEFAIGWRSADIKYDNEYIYLLVSEEEFLKIHKETLKETNIATSIDVENYPFYEISNEKFFQSIQSYYIDTVTGEKIEL